LIFRSSSGSRGCSVRLGLCGSAFLERNIFDLYVLLGRFFY
jgi:hypothetical protein